MNLKDISYFPFEVILRVIHAPNHLLTPYDLKAHVLRIDVEFATYHFAFKKVCFSWKVTFGQFFRFFESDIP